MNQRVSQQFSECSMQEYSWWIYDNSDLEKLKDFYRELKYISLWAINYFFLLLKGENEFLKNNIILFDKFTNCFKPLIRHLFSQLIEIGSIAISKNDYYISEDFSLSLKDLKEEKEIFLSKNKELKTHFDFIQKLLDKYFLIFSGEETFLNVFFEHGTFDVAHFLYEESIEAIFFNERIAEAFYFVLNKMVCRKDEGPIRILEIGAGLGAATAKILKVLSDKKIPVEYHYTDISNSFLFYGNRRFSEEYKFIKFYKFDINIHPEKQKLKENYYDIIIASNSIHNAKSCKVALKNISSLLKQGGVLLFNEGVIRNDYFTLTFGLMKQWWFYDDKELRIQDSPLLSISAWKDLLYKSGFCKIVSFCNSVGLDGLLEQDVLMASKI